MKILILITTTLFLNTVLFSQDEILFSDVKRIGAFGGPLFEYTKLGGDVETIIGGGGAIMLNDFFLGGYGMRMAEIRHASITANNPRINFRHGGLWIGFTPYQYKVVHPFASVKLGWGKTTFNSANYEAKDKIFVTTPEAGFEVNIFSFFRLSATASYRFVSGVNAPEVNLLFKDSDLSGFGGILTLRFGGYSGDWD